MVAAVWLDGDDTAVVRPLPVKAFVMAAILCQYDPAKLVRTGENIGISRSCSAVFLSSQHVMTKTPQLFHNRIGEILIGVKEHGRSLHRLIVAFVVLPNCLVDFVAVRIIVLPRRSDIMGVDRWVQLKHLHIGRALQSICDQNPDWNAMPPNASVAAANVRRFRNPIFERD
jgi:hypothetical protein